MNSDLIERLVNRLYVEFGRLTKEQIRCILEEELSIGIKEDQREGNIVEYGISD